MRSRLVVTHLSAAALLAIAASRSGAPLQAQASRVTFTETIAPIVYDNCVTCHRRAKPRRSR